MPLFSGAKKVSEPARSSRTALAGGIKPINLVIFEYLSGSLLSSCQTVNSESSASVLPTHSAALE